MDAADREQKLPGNRHVPLSPESPSIRHFRCWFLPDGVGSCRTAWFLSDGVGSLMTAVLRHCTVMAGSRQNRHSPSETNSTADPPESPPLREPVPKYTRVRMVPRVALLGCQKLLLPKEMVLLLCWFLWLGRCYRRRRCHWNCKHPFLSRLHNSGTTRVETETTILVARYYVLY